MEEKLTEEIILSEFDVDNQVVSPYLDSCQNSNVWPYCQSVLFKSFPMEEEIVESQEDTLIFNADNFESISDMHPAECDNSKEESVMHIEIIKSTALPRRRVTGISRVVPSLTSAWQRTNFKASEPSITDMYTKYMTTGVDTECEECLQQFLSSTELECHVRLQHPHVTLAPEYCFVCRKKYIFTSQLNNHLSMYHGIQFPDMMCKICFMELNIPIEMKAHERKHNKEFNCQYCTMKFASEYEYQKHFDSHMFQLKPHECVTCGKRFFNGISHNVHSNRHSKLSCMSCDLLFSKELLYLQHIKSHAPEAVQHLLNRTALLDQEEDNLDSMLETYRKVGNKRLLGKTRSASLAEEQTSVDDIEQSVVSCMESILISVASTWAGVAGPSRKAAAGTAERECKLCRLQVATAAELVEHHNERHARSRTCPFCRLLAASFGQLHKHMATHLKARRSSVPVKPALSCNFCGKIFKSKSKWNNHLEAVHKMKVTSRPYSCGDCPRTFTNEPSRDKHTLAMHSEEKTVETCVRCEVCNQAFVRSKFLTKHMQAVHEMVHSCAECDKTFPNKDKLKRHEESHKPAELRQAHKCSFCSVSCSTHSGLRVHLRIHTNERPYGCDECEMKFKRPQALKKHKLLMHTNKESISRACPDCPLKFYDHGNLLRHFLRVHKGLCRFVCGLCADRFGQNQDLRRHLKLKHDTEIPYLKGSSKKSFHEIYVLPAAGSADISPETNEKIKTAVHEESLKFEGFSERFNAFASNDIEKENNDFTSQSEITEANSQLLSSFENVFTVETPAPSLPVPEPSDPTDLQKPEPTANSFQLEFNAPFLGILTTAEEAGSVNPMQSFFRCDLCQTLFCVMSQFYEHLAKRKENACPLCSEGFCGPAGLQGHLSAAHKPAALDITYRCGICQVDFGEKDGLTEHLQDVHGVTVQFEITPQDIGSEAGAAHRRRHEDNLLLDLLDTGGGGAVGEQAASRIPLTVDEISRLDAEAAATTAAAAAPVFAYRSPGNTTPPLPSVTQQPTAKVAVAVAAAAGAEAPSAPKKMTCAQCGKHFPEVGRLIRHINTHLGVKPYKCPSCPKVFAEKHNLLVHGRVHSRERPYACKTCGQRLRYRKELADHAARHGGLRPHACLACPRAFLRSGELARHARTHVDTKRFACLKCAKSFRRADELQAHDRVHANAGRPRAFVCDVCGKRFATQRTLRQHLVLHSAEKLFVCHLCGKAFALELYLNSHLKTHSRRENYVACTKCARMFTTKENLQIHLTKFHGKMARKLGGNSRISKDVPANAAVLHREEVVPEDQGMEITEIEIQDDLLHTDGESLIGEKSDQMMYFHSDNGGLDSSFIYINCTD